MKLVFPSAYTVVIGFVIGSSRPVSLGNAYLGKESRIAVY